MPSSLGFHDLGQLERKHGTTAVTHEGSVLIDINGRRFAETTRHSRLGAVGQHGRGIDAPLLTGGPGDRLERAFTFFADMIKTTLRLAAIEDVFRAAQGTGYLKFGRHVVRFLILT